MTECELLETCSFYWSYQNHTEKKKQELYSHYCHSGELPVNCARIQYLKKHGESPPPGLSPEVDQIKETLEKSYCLHVV